MAIRFFNCALSFNFRTKVISGLVLLLCLFSSSLFAYQTPIQITSITIGSKVAPQSRYSAEAPSDADNVASDFVVGESTYGLRNGGRETYPSGTQFENDTVTSYTLDGYVNPFNFFLAPDTVAIRRTDGSRFINIWYELYELQDNVGLDSIIMQPEAVEDADLIYKNNNINSGYDNILVNEDNEGNNLIQAQTERVDIIWYNGIVTCNTDNAVFPVVERGGNDSIKVAAILSLDANGDPDEFSDLLLVRDEDWPQVGQSYNNYMILRRQNFGDDPLPLLNIGTFRGQSAQTIQGVAFSFTDFGVSPGQVVYGYSLFASDVEGTSEELIDFTDSNVYPSNTISGISGLDLVAGLTAAVSSDDCLTPATGPGGYKSALNTWLKANGVSNSGGTNEVTSSASQGASVVDWQDHWIGNHDFTTDQGTPTYNLTSSLINFNPSVEFASASLTTTNNEDFNSASFYTRKGINITFRTPTLTGASTKQVIYEQGDANRGLNIYTNGNNLYLSAWNQISDGSGAPWNSGVPVTTISSPALSSDTEYIVTLELDGNSSTTGSARAYLNGLQIGTLSNVGLLYDHSSGDITLGSSDNTESLEYNDGTSAGAFSFEGEIPEFIYCNEPGGFLLSQRRRIESYLAIKYGITLNQSSPINYLNSQGSVIFNTTLNTAVGGYLSFNKDIAGIGRDDGSELSQLTSRSENVNSVVTMSRSTEFPKDNTFLIWGNNDDAITDTETSDIPSIINRRVERIWRVSETNSSGAVSVTFDLDELTISGSPDADEYSLLIAGTSSGGVFTSAQIKTGGVIDVGNNTITFSGIEFVSGQFFTLGTGFITCSPGGVSADLAFWLKADLGTNTQTNGADVLEWADQAGSIDATEIDGGGLDPVPTEPAYNSNSINFNPAVTYTDVGSLSNSWLRTDNQAASGDMSIAVVFSTTDTQAGSNYYYSPMFVTTDDGFTDGTFAFGHANGQIITNFTNADQIDAQSTGSYNDGRAHIALTTRQALTSSGAIQIYVDSENDGSAASVTDDLDVGAEGMGIGNTPIVFNQLPYDDGQFDGDMAEIIMFNDDLTSAERQQVESYLAIKYGITLNQTTAQDYLNSSGTTIWDGITANDLYDSNIAGIGRDDASCLQQRQSKSVESTSVVTIGLGTIAANNNDNTNNFTADNSFLIWGSDGSDPDDTPITTQLPGSVTERMDPIWRVQETGTVGNTTISFDLSGLTNFTSRSEYQYQLIVASSGSTMPDLSGADTYSGGTFNGDVLTFSNIDFSDGDYFTLGTETETCSPGGVSANLELWLRADDGTDGTTDGSTVSTWIDQSTNGFNASTEGLGGGSPSNPTFEIDEINYNPAVRFYDPNSTNGVYMLTSGAHSVTGDLSMVVVFKSGQAQGVSGDFQNSPVFISTNSAVNNADYGLGMANGRLYGNASNNNAFNAHSPASPLYNNLEPFIATLTREQAVSSPIELYANSANIASGTSGNTALSSVSSFGIGNHPLDANEDVQAQLSARIGEVIVFSKELTLDEQQQVESYLAIKYGITRNVASLDASEQDYVASDGSTPFFDWDENTTYRSDIAGVGRDDGSCLAQTISKSENNDAIVTMEVSSFAADNSFLMWANDNAAIENRGNREFDQTAYKSRLNREWRVQETGTVASATITFDLADINGPTGIGTNNLNEVVMLVDSDGDFTSGYTEITSSSIDEVNNTITFTYNFTDGQFFTLASPEVAALPVELIAFNATAIQKQVYLSWTTASEENNAYFILERSSDAETFQALTEIEGAGMSTEVIKYKYTDKSPLQGRSYYRLKQVDYNGNFSYSPVRVVAITDEESYELNIRPNPVSKNEMLYIEYELPSEYDQNVKANISIISMQGQVVFNETLNPNKDQIATQVDQLAKGIYLVILESSDGFRMTKRLIVR